MGEHEKLRREVYNARAQLVYYHNVLRAEAAAGIPREESCIDKALAASSRWTDARRALWLYVERERLYGILNRGQFYTLLDAEPDDMG
jgi:hypothetical protein